MNCVLLQGFHWFLDAGFPGSNGRRLWSFLKDEADHYRSVGIDAVWIPPAYQAAGDNSVGYDVYDPYNIGEFKLPNNAIRGTKYGTNEQLKEAIDSLHGDGNKKYISVYADIVLNHKTGGQPEDYFWEAIRVEKENRNSERWDDGWESGKVELRGYTKFDYPERANAHSGFKWNARHFDSLDTTVELRQNGIEVHDTGNYIYRFLFNEAGYTPHPKNFETWVDLEKGNFDFLTSCDFDYGRTDVREEMKAWGEWFIKTFNLDGIRLDAVKHISADYMREWIGHVRYTSGKNLFAVAEYISSTTGPLHNYITEVTAKGDYPQSACLFDFPLSFKFREASKKGEDYDLRNLFQNTLVAEQPALAVTFIENHDYEFGRAFNSHVEEWFKPLAYAFILLREAGFPCIFFPDYYGSVSVDSHQGYHSGREYLDLLLKLRKQFALGEEKQYAEENVAGWVRLGFVDGAKGAMAVVINTAYDKVSTIRMNTARKNKNFYHMATIKWTPGGFITVKGTYPKYGNRQDETLTDEEGWGDFLADGGSVSIWIENGVGID